MSTNDQLLSLNRTTSAKGCSLTSLGHQIQSLSTPLPVRTGGVRQPAGFTLARSTALWLALVASVAFAPVHGQEQPGPARFKDPMSVAVDSVGNVYVADRSNHAIRKVSPSGAVTILAGVRGSTGRNDGPASAARFKDPYGVAVDGTGNVYVADTSNHAIRKISVAGEVTTLAGSGSAGSADGAGASARFHTPRAVATDSAGNVYVADKSNHTIRKITPSGAVTTLAGVCGSGGHADGPGNTAHFKDPMGVAVDSKGNVIVADKSNHAIRKVTPEGVVSTLAGCVGHAGGADGVGSAVRFKDPTGVAVDSAGNIYVADNSNHAIRKISPEGLVTTLAGKLGEAGHADGSGSSARFKDPYGVAADGAGNVYVADKSNQVIRKISPAGLVETLAGVPGSPGH